MKNAGSVNPVFLLDEIEQDLFRYARRSFERAHWKCSTPNKILTFRDRYLESLTI